MSVIGQALCMYVSNINFPYCTSRVLRSMPSFNSMRTYGIAGRRPSGCAVPYQRRQHP